MSFLPTPMEGEQPPFSPQSAAPMLWQRPTRFLTQRPRANIWVIPLPPRRWGWGGWEWRVASLLQRTTMEMAASALRFASTRRRLRLRRTQQHTSTATSRGEWALGWESASALETTRRRGLRPTTRAQWASSATAAAAALPSAPLSPRLRWEEHRLQRRPRPLRGCLAARWLVRAAEAVPAAPFRSSKARKTMFRPLPPHLRRLSALSPPLP